MLLTSTTVLANSNSRVSNIKSHGVFQGINQDATQEVLLDSADLRYLAEQIDDMENILNGLQQKSNANIKYTYHNHHTGNSTTSSNTIYASSSPGGCYRGAGHTHDATGTCKTVTVDKGPSSCYFDFGCWKHRSHTNGVGDSEGCWICYECGDHYPGWSGSSGHTCDNRHSTTVYDCGSPTNTWTIQCGWRNGEIEKAEIVFFPN